MSGPNYELILCLYPIVLSAVPRGTLELTSRFL